MPDYYRAHGGCVLSTSINKFIYITMARSFHTSLTQLKYSVVESVNKIDEIKHPIFRESLKEYNISGVEINSTSDIPSGTGLGSSSTFTVGLINNLKTYSGQRVTKEILAGESCDMEIERLKEPIGKQDQYAAAYGGLNFIKFNRDDSVEVEPIRMPDIDRGIMCDNLMMFYLGGTRSASKILREYKSSTPTSDYKKEQMCDLTRKLKKDLEMGQIESLGKTLDAGWKIKKTLATDVSNPLIDGVYDRAMNNGAVGGKLLGAGGNGFMLFYVNRSEQQSVRTALSDLREVPFRFDSYGSTVIYNDNM